MTDARRLIITVGTSLFHSASWRCEGDFSAITDYRRWCEPAQLSSPSARRAWSDMATGAAISNQIQELLTAGPEDPEVVGLFDSGFHLQGQYSAEISTLLAMRLKLDRHVALAGFLQTYSSIVLLHGGNRNPAEAAARHLAAVLREHAGVTTSQCQTLEGMTIQQELQSLVNYMENLDRSPADLVATGGYKAFAVALAHIYWQRSGDGWRLFYLHDSDMGELIQEWQVGTNHRIEVGDGVIRYGGKDDHLR